nr:hypothetical protein GCM10020093_053450 [Planobispora longispora]
MRFRDPAVAVLAAAGSRDPVRHGRQLVAFGEGIMFDAVAGAGAEPVLDDIRLGLRELLRGCCRSLRAERPGRGRGVRTMTRTETGPAVTRAGRIRR